MACEQSGATTRKICEPLIWTFYENNYAYFVLIREGHLFVLNKATIIYNSAFSWIAKISAHRGTCYSLSLIIDRDIEYNL